MNDENKPTEGATDQPQSEVSTWKETGGESPAPTETTETPVEETATPEAPSAAAE